MAAWRLTDPSRPVQVAYARASRAGDWHAAASHAVAPV